MDLSIIIINWHSAEYLRECLRSIYRNTKDISFETVVVDNASYDRCEEMIRAEFPEVVFVQSTENIGFARANNLGYTRSTGNSLLFLNPDTEVIDSAIPAMLSSLESISGAGAVGCRLLNADRSLQLNCIQPSPTVLNQALGCEYLQLRFPRLKIYGIGPLFTGNGNPQKVDVVSGACLMVRRDVFEAVGMFSDDYFMYAEDIDLCHKLRRAGYGIYHMPGASVIHYGGSSSEKAEGGSFGHVMIRESMFRYFVKTRGRAVAFLYRLSMLLLALSRLTIIALVRLCGLFVNRRNVMGSSWVKWKEIFKWSVGLRKWARELNRAGVSR